MDNKHLEMLGEAVRRTRNSHIASLELGKLVLSYVQMLEREADRDAREQRNKEQTA